MKYLREQQDGDWLKYLMFVFTVVTEMLSASDSKTQTLVSPAWTWSVSNACLASLSSDMCYLESVDMLGPSPGILTSTGR